VTARACPPAARVDFTLEVGASQPAVTVQAETQSLQTESATVGMVAEKIRKLKEQK
jgi:hypothetical protein